MEKFVTLFTTGDGVLVRMALPREKFREIVFQLLYGCDFSLPDGDEILDLMMEKLSVTGKTMREALQRTKEILNRLPEIDLLIGKFSSSYEIDRIGRVEKSILRLALYEMLFDPDVPPKVALSEAVRLSRKFSTPESGSFVNAVLDAVWQANLQADLQADSPSPEQRDHAVAHLSVP